MDVNAIVMLVLILVGSLGCLYFIRVDWKRYGAIFLISSLSAITLCYMFTYSGLYTFPNNVFHRGLLIPYGLVSTVFPLIVLIGIRYSPIKWIWKIPFYWAFVHLGVLTEVLFKQTSIYKFKLEWDLWDSYTLWWIFLLLFDLLGQKIVPDSLRKPIQSESFRYGKWAWIVFHVIVISTIFLAGVYVGVTLF